MPASRLLIDTPKEGWFQTSDRSDRFARVSPHRSCSRVCIICARLSEAGLHDDGIWFASAAFVHPRGEGSTRWIDQVTEYRTHKSCSSPRTRKINNSTLCPKICYTGSILSCLAPHIRIFSHLTALLASARISCFSYMYTKKYQILL